METPSLPWRTRVYLSFLSWATDAVSKADGTVNRRFLRCLQPPVPPINISIFGVKTYDVVIDPTTNLWFRVFVPTQQHVAENLLPVIFFFHGGGFVYLAPNVKIYDSLCRRMAKKASAIVVSVHYRRAPEHRYPIPYNDCFDVLNVLDVEENRSKWLPENVDVSRCFLVGDSAGGNIAHHVAQRTCEFNFQHIKIIGLISIQPFFGGEELTDAEIEHEGTPLVSSKQCNWYWKALMPPSEKHSHDHPIINVSGPNAMDISKFDFPATMVVVSGFDPLRDRQNGYYEWLKKSNKEAYLVEYPNMCHSFYAFQEVPEADQLLSDIKDFIHKVCSNTK